MATIRIAIITLLSLLCSCASIVSGSTTSLVVNSNPSEARLEVTNRAGLPVYKGETPAVMTLPTGGGYFKRELYTFRVHKKGYGETTRSVMARIDPWYWGNILFGGLIGFLIVDPITGAMYTFDGTPIEIQMTPRNVSINDEGKVDSTD